MLLRSPGPISPDTYSGHIRRRALCPNRLRNGMSQRSSSSRQSDILPTMVGPSKSRPPMSHRKTDLGIPCRSKSAKVVLYRGHKRSCSAGIRASIGGGARLHQTIRRPSLGFESAIRREKRLKKWNRAWKIRLIEEANPNWDDLFLAIANR